MCPADGHEHVRLAEREKKRLCENFACSWQKGDRLKSNIDFKICLAKQCLIHVILKSRWCYYENLIIRAFFSYVVQIKISPSSRIRTLLPVLYRGCQNVNILLPFLKTTLAADYSQNQIQMPSVEHVLTTHVRLIFPQDRFVLHHKISRVQRIHEQRHLEQECSHVLFHFYGMPFPVNFAPGKDWFVQISEHVFI